MQDINILLLCNNKAATNVCFGSITFDNIDLLYAFTADIRIKEEPDTGDWQLSSDSTLNTSDLSHLRVRLVDDEDQLGQEGKRLRRVACTCPNCKESGGR